jgi:hypothetical protein
MFKMKKVTAAIALGTALLVLAGCASTSAPAASSSKSTSEVKLFQGMGHTSVFRARVDKTTNKEVYSTSTVMATAVFDANDKIVDVQFDTFEIVPEAEKAGSTVFPGWPNDKIKKEDVTKDVANWKTKRERGDKDYGMNWSEQVNKFQAFFKGKTVAEIEQWFAKNGSDVNGKLLTEKATDAKDKEKYAKLTDAEKKALADVTSGASISLKDPHGDFIGALKEAFANKKEIK